MSRNSCFGMTLKFDQVDDTVTISNNGPWDFSSIVRGINYEMKVLPLDHPYTRPIIQVQHMY